MIIFLMLPRQLTLPRHLPVELTSSLPYSCSLLCAPKKPPPIKSVTSSLFLQNTRVGGLHPHHPTLPAPIACTHGASIPSALNQLRILSVATGVYESVWQLGLTLPLCWRERRSAGWPIFWSTTRSKLTCCHRQ